MLNEIEYTDIFSDKTLQNLKTKSADNLRTVGSAFANMGKTQSLLLQIMRIEEPYKAELEALAEVVVRETYGIVNDNKIIIRGRLTDNVDIQGDTEDDTEQTPDLEVEDFISDDAKRRLINSITQGGAVRGTFSYYMMKEYVDDINPELVQSYKELMDKVFGVYDDEQALALMMSMAGRGGQVGAGGVVNAYFEEDKFIIQAQAMIFPMLVHEIVKGLYEILSLEGFTSDPEQNQNIIKNVDKLQNEPEDLRYGKYIYDSLLDFVNSMEISDNRVRDYFLTELYKLPTPEFVSIVENIINDEVTSSQMRWAQTVIREIEDDLRKDDSGLSGLDYNPDDEDDEQYV